MLIEILKEVVEYVPVVAWFYNENNTEEAMKLAADKVKELEKQGGIYHIRKR